jgi:phage portal protein BeeE
MLGFNVTRAPNWFGWTITRAARAQTTAQPVDNRLGRSGSLLNVIHEPFTGAWQRNISVETCENILSSGSLCRVGLISDDISNCIKLVKRTRSTSERDHLALSLHPVPQANRYQTPSVRLAVITNKLLYGNTTILKSASCATSSLPCMPTRRVTPLVTKEGDVW